MNYVPKHVVILIVETKGRGPARYSFHLCNGNTELKAKEFVNKLIERIDVGGWIDIQSIYPDEPLLNGLRIFMPKVNKDERFKSVEYTEYIDQGVGDETLSKLLRGQ